MSEKVELNVELGNKSDSPMVTSGPSDYFPEFSFTEDKPCDLPDYGTLTIEYRLIRHSEDTRNEDRPRYSYTVEVKKLLTAVPEEDESPAKRDKSAEEALDELAKKKSEEKDEY